MTIAITRTGLDAAAFRRAAAREKDAAASRRMLALALVLEGRTRTEAAQAAGMDRQTLRDRVHRYNEAGLAGLKAPAGIGLAENSTCPPTSACCACRPTHPN